MVLVIQKWIFRVTCIGSAFACRGRLQGGAEGVINCVSVLARVPFLQGSARSVGLLIHIGSPHFFCFCDTCHAYSVAPVSQINKLFYLMAVQVKMPVSSLYSILTV